MKFEADKRKTNRSAVTLPTKERLTLSQSLAYGSTASGMWLIRRHRPSCLLWLLLFILLLTALYITFSNSELTETLPAKLLEIVDSFDSTPVECLRVDLDLTFDQPICQPDDMLLVYVLSSINNFKRRDVVRSTWGSKRNGTCLIFIIGEVPGSIPSAGELQMRIKNERRQYRDVVQINHLETYANVVYKEVAAFEWSHRFYPNISYLFKTDDDLIVDTLLLSYMAKILVTNTPKTDSFVLKYNPLLVSSLLSSDRATFFRGAWAMEYQPTLRGNHKFSVNETLWPHEFLPPYCSGFGWFMSRQTRDKLVRAAKTYPLNKVVWIGDVFASGFLAKVAKVRCSRLPITYDQPLAANCSCLMANNPLSTVCSTTFHYGVGGTEAEKYEEYRKAWKVIQQRHSLSEMVNVEC